MKWTDAEPLSKRGPRQQRMPNLQDLPMPSTPEGILKHSIARDYDGDVQTTRPKPAARTGFVCQFCGQPVNTLSDDPDERAYELKWRIHWNCREMIERYSDNLVEHPALRTFSNMVDQDPGKKTAVPPPRQKGTKQRGAERGF